MQVEDVGIEREQPGRRQRGGSAIEDAIGRRVEKRAGQKERDRGRDGAGQAVHPQRVHAREGEQQPVQQRQPHGAHLIVAGGARIHHAAGDVEVRLGIAVVEQPAVGIKNGDGGGAQQGQRRENHEDARTRCSS